MMAVSTLRKESLLSMLQLIIKLDINWVSSIFELKQTIDSIGEAHRWSLLTHWFICVTNAARERSRAVNNKIIWDHVHTACQVLRDWPTLIMDLLYWLLSAVFGLLNMIFYFDLHYSTESRRNWSWLQQPLHCIHLFHKWLHFWRTNTASSSSVIKFFSW